jgi:thymidylate synthase ThyX
MYSCKILLDSISPAGGRVTTFEVTFPRIVLAEFNTHRVFSRNSASSRAIPVEKQIKRILEDPFHPIYWGKNQKGMQAEEEFGADHTELLNKKWETYGMMAVAQAREMLEIGVHKQITNRLLEPFMWHTVIVSSTHWKNFFGLRDSKMAQPEIKFPAHNMLGLYKASKPQELSPGQWHLPLVTGVDEHTLRGDGVSLSDLVKISCGRCARVSYLTHEGKRDPLADISLYADLVKNGHMSPLEHAAMSIGVQDWQEYSKNAFELWMSEQIPMGNFFGFIQHRKTVANEAEYPREDLFDAA